jgi:hypothetical protein
MARDMSAEKVVTGKVRLSFPHLFKARAGEEGQDPKFSAELLIPKSDTATVAKIRAAQNASARTEYGKKTLGDAVPTWGDAKFNSNKWGDSLRDGDDADEQDGREERAGHWFITVRSSEQYKPGVVDKDRQPVLDQSEVYGGVFARVSMNAFPYNTQGNKGVSFRLNSVQVLGYGEPFGAPREKAEDVFDDEFENDHDYSSDDDDLI